MHKSIHNVAFCSSQLFEAQCYAPRKWRCAAIHGWDAGSTLNWGSPTSSLTASCLTPTSPVLQRRPTRCHCLGIVRLQCSMKDRIAQCLSAPLRGETIPHTYYIGKLTLQHIRENRAQVHMRPRQSDCWCLMIRSLFEALYGLLCERC